MTPSPRLLKMLLSLSLLSLLAGCAVQPPVATGDLSPVAVRDFPAGVTPATWQLEGRAAVVAGEQAGTASLRWQQAPERFQVDLRGTLGAGSLRLQGTAGSVQLITASGERYQAADARQLLAQVSGYDLPVDYLRYWLLGRPVPSLPGRVFVDAQNRVKRIEQTGWQISLDDLQSVNGMLLPGRVEVSGDGVRLRLRVQHWSVPP